MTHASDHAGGRAPSVLGRRSAGVLLHPTSLPGEGANGTFGREAYHFVDFLHAAGAHVWQVLPLNEVHAEGSPYQCQSAHAGDTRLINLADVCAEYGIDPSGAALESLFDQVRQGQGGHSGDWWARFADFKGHNAHWLDDFALYRVLKHVHGEQPWWAWSVPLRDRQEAAMAEAHAHFALNIERVRFNQFLFFEQWQRLRHYANGCGIRVFGDMPIFVAHDSADVWVHRDLFDLDDQGHALSRSGVPPDYFSATGQLWGNPLYRWERMIDNGFSWWKKRFETQLELYDFLRVDHFRGFESCWSVPMGEETAMNGHWVEVPGRLLFSSLIDHFGQLPIVAEDLGVITEPVEALRDDYGLPGMRILQFAFDGDASNPYLPHNHVRNCVVYTGTHDNDTTLGWFEACSDELRARIMAYLGEPAGGMPMALIRSALVSVATLAVLPMQDLLGLGGRHRMNTPGTCSDANWRWRFDWSMCPDSLAADFRAQCSLYGRLAY
ncbi:4-alpha-glucanotransferase [Acidihalobacter prosperus]|uniref:4-alpha-glucanotransferase n=1 Tax=Acidihalobacter prosperus TaxID=160660 RepID=A0A1A6C8M9_9GAMM|nr:4-alpha-glucanotransferase [Acidihalobacter prosperus]OBS10911.1 4-alpha-glucanotransferase (amylomaltase) [Acidihalobacter prosperus]